MFWMFMNFRGCTTIHTLWGHSIPYNNFEIPTITFCFDINFQECSTINKLLRHDSISNSNSKIPSFMFRMFMNFQGCTTIHTLWGCSIPYNNSEILSFMFWIDTNFQGYTYYLLTGCKGRMRKYKPKVFHTARACKGCLENQGLVFPGTERAPSY